MDLFQTLGLGDSYKDAATGTAAVQGASACLATPGLEVAAPFCGIVAGKAAAAVYDAFSSIFSSPGCNCSDPSCTGRACSQPPPEKFLNDIFSLAGQKAVDAAKTIWASTDQSFLDVTFPGGFFPSGFKAGDVDFGGPAGSLRRVMESITYQTFLENIQCVPCASPADANPLCCHNLQDVLNGLSTPHIHVNSPEAGSPVVRGVVYSGLAFGLWAAVRAYSGKALLPAFLRR